MAHYLVLNNLAEANSEASDDTAVDCTKSTDESKQPEASGPADNDAPTSKVAKPHTTRKAALSTTTTAGIDTLLPKRRAGRAAGKTASGKAASGKAGATGQEVTKLAPRRTKLVKA